MRKVRDFDAELKALQEKARSLKAKKIEQLGTLVGTTGADSLDADTLAGVLLSAIETADAKTREAWRAKGAAWFQQRAGKASGPGNGRAGAGANTGGAPPS